ncbi:uncharacterized protein [Pyxicephalus adspersus]|uniref:uncharacterized protein n=1 Tax=Pyxicephalus adspersus TaxID=30357 RepID=UPI003B5A873B
MLILSINWSITCGQPKENIEVWIETNFGKFAQYIEISEYIEWNVEYKATEVISFLSADQLAEVAVSAVNNEEVACQISAKLLQFDVTEVNNFLTKLSSTLRERNIHSSYVVGKKFLSSSLSVISSSLSTYSTSEWVDLVSSKLQPLFFSIDSEQLSTLLNSADCNAYRAISQQLNDNYDKFAPDARQNLFGVLFGYISKKKSDSGFCPVSGEDSSAAITNTIGKFSSFLTYSQFKEISPSFDWVSSESVLGVNQLAEISLADNVFSNQDKANALNGRLAKLSFTDIDAYLQAFQANAEAKHFVSVQGGAIQQSIFNTIFSKVSEQFTVFSDSQWNFYFGSLFSWFYSSLQASQVELIPVTISCTSFQSVVSGTSRSYSQLQGDVQTALYGKIVSILKNQKTSSGSACPITGGSAEWLLRNFGELRVKASIADIIDINPNFIVTDAVSYLTAEQLGTYAASKAILSDKDKIDKLMSGLNSQSIGVFLDAFNAAAEKNGITAINNEAVRKFFIGEIFCKAGSGFTSFTESDYAEFFQNKLKVVLSSLDAKAFGFIPKDLGCDSLAAIMQPLINAQNPENPTDVFDFVNSVLSGKKSGSGAACADNNIDTRAWVGKFLGGYVKAGSWDSIIYLYPKFDVASCADLLSDTQLSIASTGSTVIQNVTVITSVVATFNGDINSLYTFVDTLWRNVAVKPDLLTSSKVKDVVLDAVAKNVLTKFDSLSAVEVQDWLSKLTFLLPSFNATILDYIPKSIDCPQLQAFVSSMDLTFSSLTAVKQQAVANFIQNVLSYKVNSGDDPCISGSTTTQWVTKNLASFCSLLSADDMAAINSNLDKVSYARLCIFTP